MKRAATIPALLLLAAGCAAAPDGAGGSGLPAGTTSLPEGADGPGGAPAAASPSVAPAEAGNEGEPTRGGGGGGREAPSWEEWTRQVASRSAERFLVPRSYRGKYDGDPRLEAGLRRLEAAWPAALERVRRRLGDPAREPPRVIVAVVDGDRYALDNSMATRLVPSQGGPLGLIVAAAEDRVTGLWDESVCLSHELAHVLHLAGGGATSSTPDWVAEGLAHWFEADGEDSLRARVLLWSITATSPGDSPPADEPSRTPISLLLADPDGLASAPEEAQRVAGMVVFFQIERILGEERFRALVRRLLEDPDWKSAIEEASGRPWPELLGEIRSGYREWTGRAFPDLAVLGTAGDLARREKYDEALEVLDDHLPGASSPPVRTLLGCLRIRVLAAKEEHGRLVEACRAFRTEAARGTGISWTEIDVHECRALWALGRWEEVITLGEAMIRDSLWGDPDARREVRKWVEAAKRRRLTGGGPPGEETPEGLR